MSVGACVSVRVLTRGGDGEAYGLTSGGVGCLRHVVAFGGGVLKLGGGAGGWTSLWSGVGWSRACRASLVLL